MQFFVKAAQKYTFLKHPAENKRDFFVKAVQKYAFLKHPGEKIAFVVETGQQNTFLKHPGEKIISFRQIYRPITIIPLLYKIFARLLYNRLEPQLDQHQPPKPVSDANTAHKTTFTPSPH